MTIPYKKQMIWTQNTVLMLALVCTLVAFILIITFAVGLQSTNPPPSTTPSKPQVITGAAPLTQGLSTNQIANLAQTVPNVLPWSNTTPAQTRPTTAFSVTLPTSQLLGSDTYLLSSGNFVQQDPNIADRQPLQTVIIVPPNTPSSFLYIQDKDTCTLENQATNINCGILPSIGPNGQVLPQISPFNITGPFQNAFAIQNQSSHTIFQTLNRKLNQQFAIPAGKTAIFKATKIFWPILQFRGNNPQLPMAPEAQLQWVGSLLPAPDGAYPQANVATPFLAAQAGAAEAETSNQNRSINF